MRIILINPPNSGKSIPEEEYGIKTIKSILRGEPLALEAIAGSVSDHDILICDLKADPDSLQNMLQQFKPDIAGITGVTCEANSMLKIAKTVKDISGSTVVVGGHHASCDPEFFNKENIDYIIPGIGRLAFKMLVETIQNKGVEESFMPVDGVIKTNPGHGLTWIKKKYSEPDLMDDVLPRYDLVEKYRDTYIMGGVGAKVGFVVIAYGCTHRCLFCSIPNMTGGRYLTHSINAVIKSINELKNINVIRFVDANTFGNIDHSRNLAQQLIDNGLKKRFIVDVRADTVVKYPELFKLWKDAGLSVAVIGFEEIRDDRLAEYDKRIRVADNISAIRILKEIGIMIIGDFIISPDYNADDFEALEEFVRHHKIDLPMPTVLTPIPGTPIYDQMKHKIIIHDLDYYTFSNAVLPTYLEPEDFYMRYSSLLRTFHERVK